jgi:hypothetical protein
MKTIWKQDDRQELRARVRRLTPRHAAKWGKMTAPAMVAHLNDALRMATGELAVAPKKVPLRFPPLKQLGIYWVPIPKNLPTIPELIVRPPRDFTIEVTDLDHQLDTIERRGPGAMAPAHPAFGRMTGKAWGALVYRHMDHHLRQFGE